MSTASWNAAISSRYYLHELIVTLRTARNDDRVTLRRESERAAGWWTEGSPPKHPRPAPERMVEQPTPQPPAQPLKAATSSQALPFLTRAEAAYAENLPFRKPLITWDPAALSVRAGPAGLGTNHPREHTGIDGTMDPVEAFDQPSSSTAVRTVSICMNCGRFALVRTRIPSPAPA